MTTLHAPSTPMQLPHRGLYIAVVVSVFVHASMLVNFHVRETSPGQKGSELYVSAQLSNDQFAPVDKLEALSPPVRATSNEDIVMAASSSEQVAIADKNEKKDKAKNSPEKVVMQDPSKTGMAFSANGRPDYLAKVLKQIDARKKYPYRAWRDHIEGNVDIRMLIYHDGSANVLVADSEFAALSTAAKRAITSAQPFPIPVEDNSGTPIRLSFTMEFRIRD